MNIKEFYFSHQVADWCSVADLLVLLYRKRRAIKMGRDAMKAAGNPWYEARKKASEYDDRLRSREGAAELLGMSVSSVADAELDLSKCMPVDKAVLMADLYKAPHLLNYYCLNECPIGCRHCISDEVIDIERATLKLLKILDEEKLNEVKRKLNRGRGRRCCLRERCTASARGFGIPERAVKGSERAENNRRYSLGRKRWKETLKESLKF